METHLGSALMLLILCSTVTINGALSDEFANIIESKSTNDGKGNYEFQVRTSDGITRWEAGRLMYSGEKPYIHVEGGYLYIDRTDSVKRIVTFVADQNGYRPSYSEEPSGALQPQYAPSRFLQGAAK